MGEGGGAYLIWALRKGSLTEMGGGLFQLIQNLIC